MTVQTFQHLHKYKKYTCLWEGGGSQQQKCGALCTFNMLTSFWNLGYDKMLICTIFEGVGGSKKVYDLYTCYGQSVSHRAACIPCDRENEPSM